MREEEELGHHPEAETEIYGQQKLPNK